MLRFAWNIQVHPPHGIRMPAIASLFDSESPFVQPVQRRNGSPKIRPGGAVPPALDKKTNERCIHFLESRPNSRIFPWGNGKVAGK